MVALGKMGQVWLDLPDEDEEEDYHAGFEQAFGVPWEQALVGAEQPFAYHLPWTGYFAVTELVDQQGLTLLDLPPKGRFNIIVG